MQRLRISLKGRVLGFIKVDWCWTKTLVAVQVPIAEVLRGWLDGTPVRSSILNATIFVTIGTEP